MADRWLDRATTYVRTEVLAYNANIDALAVVRARLCLGAREHGPRRRGRWGLGRVVSREGLGLREGLAAVS